MIRTIRTLLFCIILLSSCTKGDEIPGYVHILQPTLSTTPVQGANSANVTDAWIYANDEFLGSWELPAYVPILKEGDVTIRILPAIKRNGMFDDRLIYPFFTSSVTTLSLTPTNSATFQPSISYTEQADFWIEDFQDAGTAFFLTDTADNLDRFSNTQYPDIVLNDTPCGGFTVTQDNPSITLYTDEDFTATNGPTFLEMDYKSNIDMEVGLFYTLDGISQSSFILGVTRSDRDGTMIWRKIYVDLSAAFNVQITQRDIYIKATLPNGQTSGTVYLDNIKLVR